MRPDLSNSNASPEARRLYGYLCSMQGKGILAGQQECPENRRCGSELAHIRRFSGKSPAIRGLDYIHDDFDGVNRRAKAWHKKGGIVTICWHWGTPPDGIGYPSSQGTIDLEEALTPGTALHEGMLRQMDRTAEALQELRDAKIPVLWRPFHEFDGAWFWWGKGGSGAFIRLWRLMYERYTKKFKLDNLIWVLGYCGDVHEGWFPGDEYVDIVGADTYKEGIQANMYRAMEKITGDKFLICYHENGPMPDPEELKKGGISWSWFMTWHTIHIRRQNTTAYLNHVYNHPYTITLDKLPQWQ